MKIYPGRRKQLFQKDGSQRRDSAWKIILITGHIEGGHTRFYFKQTSSLMFIDVVSEVSRQTQTTAISKLCWRHKPVRDLLMFSCLENILISPGFTETSASLPWWVALLAPEDLLQRKESPQPQKMTHVALSQEQMGGFHSHYQPAGGGH